MARDTLVQRIALEGGEDIKRELEALGRSGELAFRKLQQAANELKGPPSAFLQGLRNAQKELERIGKSLDQTGENFRRIGRNLSTFLTVPVVAGFGLAVKAAADFESAMADVRKVVDFPTPDAFKQMGDDIREMSTQLPLAAADLAAIAAAAGQAGIAAEDLTRFTELVAKAAVAFDLSAEGAGEALAKVKTALGLTIPEVELLADAMNTLANNAAASEADVLDVVSRTAALGDISGVSATEIAALGAAMVSMGVESETAATAIRNILIEMQAGEGARKAQSDAWKQLGLDAVEVSRRIQREGIGAILDVFERINREAPEVRASILTALFDKRAVDAAGPLLNNLDELQRLLGLVGEQAQFAGSTQEEFAVRAGTAANQFQLFRNAIDNLRISIGNELLPVFTKLATRLSDVINSIADNQAWVRWGIVIAAAAAALGPLVGALGLLLIGLGGFLRISGRIIGSLAEIGAKAGGLTRGLGVLLGALTRVAGFAGFAVLAGQIAYLTLKQTGAEESADKHKEALDALNTAFDAVVTGADGATQAFQRVSTEQLNAAKAAVIEARAQLEAARIRAQSTDLVELGLLDAKARALQAEDFFNQTVRQLQEIEDRITELNNLRADPTAFADLQERMRQSSEAAARVGQAFDVIGQKAGAAGQEAAKATRQTGEALEEATQKAERYITVWRNGEAIRFPVIDGVVQAAEEAGEKVDELDRKTGEVAKSAEHASGELISVQEALRAAGQGVQDIVDRSEGLPAEFERAADAAAKVPQAIQQADIATPVATEFQTITTEADTAFQDIGTGAEAAGQRIAQAFTAAGEGTRNEFATIAAEIDRLFATLGQGGAAVTEAAEGAGLGGGGPFANLVNSAQSAKDAIVAIFSGLRAEIDRVLSGGQAQAVEAAGEAPQAQSSFTFADMVASAQAAAQAIISSFAAVGAQINQALTIPPETFDGLVESAESTADGIGSAFSGLGATLRAAFKAIVSAIESELAALESAVRSLIARLEAELRRLQAAIRAAREEAGSGGSGGQGFAGGGSVHGTGTGTSDSILAWLSNGEFVQRAAAVRYYGVDFMRALNSLRLPKDLFRGFSVGGFVDSFDRAMSSLVPVPAFAQGGLAMAVGGSVPSAGGRTIRVDLGIGGERFEMIADEEVAGRFSRFLTSVGMRSTGSMPGWASGRR